MTDAPGMRSITIVKPDTLFERIDKAAKERDVKRAWFMRRAAEYYLEHLIPAEDIRWTR